MESFNFDQKYYEPGTTSIEVQSLENSELVNTTTPSITESLMNIAASEKIPITTTTNLPINSTADIFRYMKGTVYDNIQHLWRSKLFEQKLASTRISVNTQSPPTTSTTSTTTYTTAITSVAADSTRNSNCISQLGACSTYYTPECFCVGSTLLVPYFILSWAVINDNS